MGPWVLGPIFWMGLLVPDFSFFAGLAYFSPDLCVYATSAAPPSHCTPIHKGIHKGGRPPPFVEAAEGRLLYGWVCGGWGGQQTWQKHASPAKNKQVRRKNRGQGQSIPSGWTPNLRNWNRDPGKKLRKGVFETLDFLAYFFSLGRGVHFIYDVI